MPQITHLRTPVDPELLEGHLRALCAGAFRFEVVGQEEGAFGLRNIICVTFSAASDYPMLAEAVRKAHGIAPSRDTDSSTE